MINQNKWINSLPKSNIKFNQEVNKLDHHIWVNTISKKKTYNSVKKYSVKKYSVTATLFFCGLLFVAAIKNETRNLQKEINHLEETVSVIKFNLKQAILDNEVITAPENIARLAKENLNIDLISYKRSQIKELNSEFEMLAQIEKEKKKTVLKKESKTLTNNIKSQVAKKIMNKKAEIKKLKELYHNPKNIPGEIKIKVAKKIEMKKTELEKIYNSPKETISLQKIQKWGAVQVVKAFLGLPIIPGR